MSHNRRLNKLFERIDPLRGKYPVLFFDAIAGNKYKTIHKGETFILDEQEKEAFTLKYGTDRVVTIVDDTLINS